METQKVLRTLSSAAQFLQEAITANVEGDLERVAKATWRAAAELEFGLFLFSLWHAEAVQGSSGRVQSVKQQEEVTHLLKNVKSFVEDAAASLEAKELEETYKRMWKSRSILLKVQSFLDKQSRKLVNCSFGSVA